MTIPSADYSQVKQVLHWASLHQERLSPPDTMFAHTGRRIYVLGDIDGRFRPRSNPYDLHAFGHPDPRDPLANKLQGVWAQPVKGFNAYGYTLALDGESWALEDAGIFTQAYAFVTFQSRRGALLADRRDFAAQDLPILFSILTLKNEGQAALEIEARFAVEFDLQDAWFTHLGSRRNAGQTVTVENNCLVARAELLPEQWSAAAGMLPANRRMPATAQRKGAGAGELVISLRLDPCGEARLVSALVVESQGGAPAALALLADGLSRWEDLLAEREAAYAGISDSGPRLVSPDSGLNVGFSLAQANLRMLEAENETMGRYFYAGLEMFPFWFSNDGAYSVPGLAAGGMVESALNHVRIGLDHLGQGRIPHQISPAGHVAFAGNAQETQLWVMSIWDAYRWSGDREFLARLYPGARKGMFDYVLGAIDPDGDGYPSGPGMVEVEGMGAEKLDSAAYTWSALQSLAEMADALDDGATAARARGAAQKIFASFDVDWWDEPSGLYAMSLEDPGNRRMQVPHWAVAVPLEVGLAAPDHAAQTLATMRRDFVNRWGIRHTAGEDERVWTLPVATLSRAAYRYGDLELGESMLRHIADTLGDGPIGLLHELIPQGACIIQLWSAATFIRGIVEDLLGIEVNAAQHTLRIKPHLPQAWDSVTLENLSFGEHRVTIHAGPTGIRVEHREGIAPIEVIFGQQNLKIVPGKTAEL